MQILRYHYQLYSLISKTLKCPNTDRAVRHSFQYLEQSLLPQGEIWDGAELALDLGWDRWLEDSLAQLILALPAGCCKALFRNPPTPRGLEHSKDRVLSTSGAERWHILAEWLNQWDDWGSKPGVTFGKLRTAPGAGEAWCHFPRRAHAERGDAEIKRPVKLASLCRRHEATACVVSRCVAGRRTGGEGWQCRLTEWKICAKVNETSFISGSWFSELTGEVLRAFWGDRSAPAPALGPPPRLATPAPPLHSAPVALGPSQTRVAAT